MGTAIPTTDPTDEHGWADTILRGILQQLEGGGISASADFTPAAAAYSAGDVQDVAKQFSFTDRNGIAVPVGSLIRILTSEVKIGITAVPSGMTSYSLPIHSVTPPSALADNAAWVPTAADQTSYRGSVALGSPVLPVAGAGFIYIRTQYQDFDVKLDAAASSVFAYLVTAGAFTATAVARKVVLYGVLL